MPNIIRISGPETAFVAELLTVVERHSGELTVHQICGGLFDTACCVLRGDVGDLEDAEDPDD